jgi:FkbM family methyltransferase
VIYSAGVGLDISFEKELVSRFGVTVYLFDPSTTGIATMSKPENQVAGIEFVPLGLAGKSGSVSFSFPKDKGERSFTINGESDYLVEFECRTLTELMRERRHSQIDLLKMDIEGFEYEVLESIFRDRIQIKQICLEFHHFFKSIPKARTQRAISDLASKGYVLVYKEDANYTFLHADLVQ